MKFISITYIIIIILGFVGWIMNIFKIFSGDIISSTITLSEIPLMFVIRVIGIFVPPLGAVVGFL